MISNRFLELGFSNFNSAAEYVQLLPYKRNRDNENLLCVFNDLGGTCSTKHRLLKTLAIENNFKELQLMLGIFMMNSTNTSKISQILKNYDLKEMPEAHTYLRIKNQILDFTRKNSSAENFVNDLVQEMEIQPSQITIFKPEYHQDFLQTYLNENLKIPYSLVEFWKIREECILALQH